VQSRIARVPGCRQYGSVSGGLAVTAADASGPMASADECRPWVQRPPEALRGRLAGVIAVLAVVPLWLGKLHGLESGEGFPGSGYLTLNFSSGSWVHALPLPLPLTVASGALLADSLLVWTPRALRQRGNADRGPCPRIRRAGIGENVSVRVSAKADYAVRAAVELALGGEEPVTADAVAQRQDIPVQFLHKIFLELQRARLVTSQRGPEGGQRLARPAEEITVADVMRAVDGPLATVRRESPESLDYPDSAQSLQEVWIALRTNVRAVLEGVTLADLAAAALPPDVAKLALEAESWVTR
jgi:Rrf2 family protein